MKISETKLSNPGHFLPRHFLLHLPVLKFPLKLSNELTPPACFSNLRPWQSDENKQFRQIFSQPPDEACRQASHQIGRFILP